MEETGIEGIKFREMDGEREKKRGRDTGIQKYEGKRDDIEPISRYMNGRALHIVHQGHCIYTPTYNAYTHTQCF